MFSGVAGLRAHQVKMDVVANNISNVNTYGYKTSRIAFSEMYSQTLKPASGAAASGLMGGVNPQQIGLGVQTASIDVIHTQGATQTTDRGLDMMINGEGFFVVREGADIFYTRAGNMYMDEYGYLTNADGMYLQGIMLLEDFAERQDDVAVEEAITEKWDNDADNILPQGMTPEELLEDGTFPLEIDPESEDLLLEASVPVGRIVIPPWYKNISIGQDGLIQAENELGELVNVAYVMTATFSNPGGLDRVGSNLYRDTANSGSPAFCPPGVGTSGTVTVGAVEMSNVDLSKEFTEMIITQRGFQSNSRIITVSDTLLEELVNLKR
jgi:flagellar hook protein FlgE